MAAEKLVTVELSTEDEFYLVTGLVLNNWFAIQVPTLVTVPTKAQFTNILVTNHPFNKLVLL